MISSSPILTPALEPQFRTLEQQRDASLLGMWVFLATETLMFGSIIVAFMMTRVFYPYEFAQAAGRMNILIGGINTFVLLTSCLAMALAVHAAQKGRRGAMLTCLSVTALLGLSFLGLKLFEYYADWRDGIVPNTARFRPEGIDPQRLSLYVMFYFIMTGLHFVHLSIGIIIVSWLIVRTAQKNYPMVGATVTETIGLYWSFVDIVWLFLLPTLYLSGSHTLSDLHF